MKHLPPPRNGKRRNLLRNVAQLALRVCSARVPCYAHPKSKPTYTQPQLRCLLIHKGLRKQTCRGQMDLLELSDGLQEVLGLKAVPDYSTLAKFSKRVCIPQLLDGLVAEIVAHLGLAAEEMALDATGLETSPASVSYRDRGGKKRGRYVTVSLAVACTTVMVLAMVLSFGPDNDMREAPELLWQLSGRHRPRGAYLDSG
jgi:hypothetical protein